MPDDINRNDDALTPEPPETPETPAQPEANLTTPAPVEPEPDPAAAEAEAMQKRLERLGGEPAPAISPEEFARLQQAGQIHIDSKGRVRTSRREETDAGMSLRKRRAWYTARGAGG